MKDDIHGRCTGCTSATYMDIGSAVKGRMPITARESMDRGNGRIDIVIAGSNSTTRPRIRVRNLLGMMDMIVNA